MSASSNRLFVWDVYSGPHGAMLVLPSGEVPPADEGWEVHTLGVSSAEAWDLTATCRKPKYAILEVHGEVYCRYEGAGALAIASEDAAHYVGGVARLATTNEIATWPK